MNNDLASPNEDRLIAEMLDILRRKMERDYAPGATLRDAHPKAIGVLHGTFTVLAGLPDPLRVGVFAQPREFGCWIRSSSASGKTQADTVPDFRGLAIKLLESTPTDGLGKSVGQDFLLMNFPTMPLGTVQQFRDAIYYSIESSPLLMLTKFILTGQASILRDMKKGRTCPASVLDQRYWSTTPYRFGPGREVKYSLLPTSTHHSTMPANPTDDYLSRTLQAHLEAHEANFDFCVQLRQDKMLIEDSGIRWDETLAPFVKVATLRIPKQNFQTAERRALGETLSFSPGHAWPDHQAIGGVNRARIAIYAKLSEFRHHRDGRANLA